MSEKIILLCLQKCSTVRYFRGRNKRTNHEEIHIIVLILESKIQNVLPKQSYNYSNKSIRFRTINVYKHIFNIMYRTEK